MIELKPCPFCGRTPNVEEYRYHSYFVRCKCGIEQSRFYWDEYDAVKHWNTRKDEPWKGADDEISCR